MFEQNSRQETLTYKLRETGDYDKFLSSNVKQNSIKFDKYYII